MRYESVCILNKLIVKLCAVITMFFFKLCNGWMVWQSGIYLYAFMIYFWSYIILYTKQMVPVIVHLGITMLKCKGSEICVIRMLHTLWVRHVILCKISLPDIFFPAWLCCPVIYPSRWFEAFHLICVLWWLYHLFLFYCFTLNKKKQTCCCFQKNVS